ncbi:hypothetical protein QJQ45_020096 [Haematococcus lacustris]|nr:hypothetical protein QJQ45_020096 [Haematococcus lacustris]
MRSRPGGCASGARSGWGAVRAGPAQMLASGVRPYIVHRVRSAWAALSYSGMGPGATTGAGHMSNSWSAGRLAAGPCRASVASSTAGTVVQEQPPSSETPAAEHQPAPCQAEPTLGAGAAAWPKQELPKNFEAATAEPRIYAWWEQQGYFKPQASAASAEPFVISMPPPNVTGRLHMGHAMFATLQDVMIRTARMRGLNALWVPGTDHAGIATQVGTATARCQPYNSVVEKMLAQQGSSRLGLGRQAFEAKVWEWKGQYGGFITEQLRRLGASCDWDRERFTLDQGLSEAVVEAFVRLYDKGLIYKGSYMVNWSPAMLTAVSDLEVDYCEEPGFIYFFKYPIVGGENGAFLPVATTRPETILGDTAVAVHPEDPRYQHLIGMECEVPMSGGRRIPVIADSYVDREFGTGALKITPGHDHNDYEIGKRLGLPLINIMNKDATLNAHAGKYAGMERFQARKALWADLEASGLAIKKDNYTIRAPRSQRSGEVVEPLVSEQWFVRMEPLAQPALSAVARGDITLLPQRFEKVYNNWLSNIKDWCISRQLWWGHRIPAWYVFDSAQEAGAAADGRSQRCVVARSEAEALDKARQLYGQRVHLVQEADVLDTWFSSGLWPFSTLGWPNTTAPDLQNFYPTQVMETGHDILFFWVARMIMMGLEFTGQAPFHTVYLHGLVRDDKGRKMSKSLGNVIDPLVVIDQFGTDALRFTMATGNPDPTPAAGYGLHSRPSLTLLPSPHDPTPDLPGTAAGQDLNLSMDRITANRNFTNKIWNAGKFILFQMERARASGADMAALEARLAAADFSSQAALEALPLAERWIVSRLHQVGHGCLLVLERSGRHALVSKYMQVHAVMYCMVLQVVDEVCERHDKYDFNLAGVATYNFFWDEFADWYIEASKTRPSGSEVAETSLAVAVYVFDKVLRLLHPFMPFVTEELWQALPHTGNALIVASWPILNAGRCHASLAHWDTLQGVVRAVRNARAEYNVEVRCSSMAGAAEVESAQVSKKIGALIIVEQAAERAALEVEMPVAMQTPAMLCMLPCLHGPSQPYRPPCALQVISLLARLDPALTQLLGAVPDALPEATLGQGVGGQAGGVSKAAQGDASSSSSSVSLVVKEGVQVSLPMAGLFDVAKELARLQKQRAKLQKDVDGITAKLSNPKFMERASQDAVREAQAQQIEASEKLAMVDVKIAQLHSLSHRFIAVSSTLLHCKWQRLQQTPGIPARMQMANCKRLSVDFRLRTLRSEKRSSSSKNCQKTSGTGHSTRPTHCWAFIHTAAAATTAVTNFMMWTVRYCKPWSTPRPLEVEPSVRGPGPNCVRLVRLPPPIDAYGCEVFFAVKSLEDSIIDFIANPEQDVLEFPLQLTTYQVRVVFSHETRIQISIDAWSFALLMQRMLAHKAAQHYGLQTTTTDYEGGVRVVAHRRATLCRQPRTRLSSLVVPLEVAYARSSGADKPRQLLRRPNGYERGDQRDIQRTGAWSAKSAKEREEEYARAKERIMGPMASESAPPAGPANGPSARGGRGAWGYPEHGGGMQPQLQAHNDALGPRGRAGRRGFARERSSEMQQDPDFMRGIHRYGPTAAFDPYAQPQQAAQAAPYPPGMQMYSIPTYQTAFPQMGPQGLMHMPQVPVPQLPVQAGVGSRGFPAYARQTPFSSQFNSSSNSSTTGGSMATYPISSAAAAAAGALPPSQASGHANHRPQQGASQQQHRIQPASQQQQQGGAAAAAAAGVTPQGHTIPVSSPQTLISNGQQAGFNSQKPPPPPPPPPPPMLACSPGSTGPGSNGSFSKHSSGYAGQAKVDKPRQRGPGNTGGSFTGWPATSAFAAASIARPAAADHVATHSNVVGPPTPFAASSNQYPADSGPAAFYSGGPVAMVGGGGMGVTHPGNGFYPGMAQYGGQVVSQVSAPGVPMMTYQPYPTNMMTGTSSPSFMAMQADGQMVAMGTPPGGGHGFPPAMQGQAGFAMHPPHATAMHHPSMQGMVQSGQHAGGVFSQAVMAQPAGPYGSHAGQATRMVMVQRPVMAGSPPHAGMMHVYGPMPGYVQAGMDGLVQQSFAAAATANSSNYSMPVYALQPQGLPMQAYAGCPTHAYPAQVHQAHAQQQQHHTQFQQHHQHHQQHQQQVYTSQAMDRTYHPPRPVIATSLSGSNTAAHTPQHSYTSSRHGSSNPSCANSTTAGGGGGGGGTATVSAFAAAASNAAVAAATTTAAAAAAAAPHAPSSQSSAVQAAPGPQDQAVGLGPAAAAAADLGTSTPGPAPAKADGAPEANLAAAPGGAGLVPASEGVPLRLQGSGDGAAQPDALTQRKDVDELAHAASATFVLILADWSGLCVAMQPAECHVTSLLNAMCPCNLLDAMRPCTTQCAPSRPLPSHVLALHSQAMGSAIATTAALATSCSGHLCCSHSSVTCQGQQPGPGEQVRE